MRSRKHVLLIEDDHADALFFQRIMRQTKLAHPAQLVPDAETAMAYLEGSDLYADRQRFPFPSVAFLDLNLPNCPGFQFLSWLRQQRRFHRLPVIVLTGSSKTIDVYRAYELGADSYLAKPVTLHALGQLARSLNLPFLARRSGLRSFKTGKSRPPTELQCSSDGS